MSEPKSFLDLVVPAYDDAWNAWVSGNVKDLWLLGGRGSLKSTFAAYCIVASVMANPGVNAVVYRKHGNGINGSVYNQCLWAIQRIAELSPAHRIMERWRFRQQPCDMTFDGERSIVFKGLDDPTKSKSSKPKNGYFGFVWFEELDEFDGMAEIRSVKQSILRGGPIGQSVYSFNPPQSTAAWVNAEAARSGDGKMVVRTNYLDVARFHPDWLGETFLSEARQLKRDSLQSYRHEYLGEAIGTGGEIFANVRDAVITDEQILHFKNVRHGMDFGFTNDPTTLMSLAYDTDTRTVYVFGEDYRHGLFTDGIADLLTARKLTRSADIVVADSAEKRVIGELQNRGFNVRGCFKNADGWREDGLRWMRSRAAIVIDSRRCPNAFREFSQYEYGRYGNGEYRTDYPDGNDHTIDGCRYGLEDLIKADVMRRAVVMPTSFKRRG